MKRISLLQLKEKQKGRVLEILGGHTLQNKLFAIGVYPGKEIVKISKFVLRGPITIKAGRSVIALGHAMAAKVIVEIHE